MEIVTKQIPHIPRNKYLINGSGLVVNGGASSSGGGASSSSSSIVETWFYQDENNNIHCKFNLIGDLEVSAFGKGTSSGSTSGGTITVYDGLDSTNPEIALSANMGRVLNEKINNIPTGSTECDLSNYYNIQQIDDFLNHKLNIDDAVGKKYRIDGVVKGETFNGNNTASGKGSHAEGFRTTASGISAHAEGDDTTASGDGSHAEGISATIEETGENKYVVASGKGSHAEGGGTTASADFSHSEGVWTIASGIAAHAEGSNGNGQRVTASGMASHAEGSGTQAQGQAAHSEGAMTIAVGNASHAGGLYTIANNHFEFACGKYNQSNSNTIFSIGNGTASERKNALEVTTEGTTKIQKNLIASGEIIAFGDGTSSGGDTGSTVLVYDGLDSTNPEIALSANMGRELKRLIDNVPSGGECDLSNYYNKSQVNNLLNEKSDTGHTHSQYLTEHQDISNLATKDEIPTSLPANGGTANYANSAGSATNDGNGNNITSTYLPYSGGTITGDLTLNKALVFGDRCKVQQETNSTTSDKILNFYGDSYYFNSGNVTIKGNLSVAANLYFEDGVHLQEKLDDNGSSYLNIDSGSKLDVTSDLTVNGNILATGEITAYSDRRLKSNIKELKNRGYVTPVTYIKDNKESIGFIAQDVQKLYPELVVEDSNGYLTLNYQQYTAVLQAQIIELNEKINELKNIIENGNTKFNSRN